MEASGAVSPLRPGQMVRGDGEAAPRSPIPPRPYLGPPAGATHEDELRGMQRQLTQHLAEQRALFHQLMSSVGTIDAQVFEHDTQELNPTVSTFTMDLPAQTAQTEFITGVYAAIVSPNLQAAPTITLENAWAQLGSDYINLNAVLNSSAGTGGILGGNYRFILRKGSVRELNLVASASWPAGAYVTFALFGIAVPTMNGGVLH